MNPNWSHDAWKEIIDPNDPNNELKAAQIKRQLWGLSPVDPLDELQQDILKEIIDSERTWSIPPEFVDMDNPNFVDVMGRVIEAGIENDKSWDRVSKRLWGFDPQTSLGRRKLNLIRRLHNKNR